MYTFWPVAILEDFVIAHQLLWAIFCVTLTQCDCKDSKVIFFLNGGILFEGVLIYVNNVERGQPEVYVVLEEAQIGVRIRESYSVDIDRMPMYQESMGILDIALSVPPQYGVVCFRMNCLIYLNSLSNRMVTKPESRKCANATIFRVSRV